jgi:hypothetical protein
MFTLPSVSGICHRYRDRKTKEEKAEIKKLKQDEGIVELDDEEKEKLIDLDQFTAQVECMAVLRRRFAGNHVDESQCSQRCCVLRASSACMQELCNMAVHVRDCSLVLMRSCG